MPRILNMALFIGTLFLILIFCSSLHLPCPILWVFSDNNRLQMDATLCNMFCLNKTLGKATVLLRLPMLLLVSGHKLVSSSFVYIKTTTNKQK